MTDHHVSRRVRRAGVALLVAGLLSACSEQALDDLQGQVEDAVDDAQSQIEQIDPSDIELPDIGAPGQDASDPVTEPDAPSESAATPSEPAPSPSPSAVPTDEGEVEGLPWWAWLLIVLALVLLVGAIAAAQRRRADAAARRARLRDQALAETDWLLAAAREQAVAVDAAPRARDVRVRWDRLQEALATLGTELAADTRRAPVVADLRSSTSDLVEVLVTRLDDAVAGRPAGDTGLAMVVDRVRDDRDRFAATLADGR